LAFLPERTCAICYQDQNPASTSEVEILGANTASGGGGVIGSATTDVVNPYETLPCGCIYCFVCIASKLEAEEGDGWSCLRCAEIVKNCRPWHGDVVVERRQSATVSKSVGFAEPKGDLEDQSLEEVEPSLEGDFSQWSHVEEEEEEEAMNTPFHVDKN
jgi:peroxin-2